MRDRHNRYCDFNGYLVLFVAIQYDGLLQQLNGLPSSNYVRKAMTRSLFHKIFF